MSEREIPEYKTFIPHVFAVMLEQGGKEHELSFVEITDSTKLRMHKKHVLSREQLQERQTSGQKRRVVDVRVQHALWALQRVGYVRNHPFGSELWMLTTRAPSTIDLQDAEDILQKLEVLGERDEVIADESAREGLKVWPRHKLKATNVILYGPPGTGKTYATIERAVKLIDPGFNGDERADYQARFEELIQVGQLAFVTFHQSYGYEDFVEGIRPVVRDGQVHYEVRAGIFKKMALAASQALVKRGIQASLWSTIVRMLNAQPDKYVSLVGDDLVATYSGGSTSAPAKIKRDAIEQVERQGLPAVQDRVQGEDPTTREALRDFLAKAWRSRVPQEVDEVDEAATKQFVLIIDEINRGNISRIFGELITLLEPSKRQGAADFVPVTLPISDEVFGVPPNLHIIGTMNTADRSIALLDVALRRRFKFEELMPRAELVTYDRARRVMEVLNSRIELLLGRDRQLGHALFMGATIDAELYDVLVRDVLPLLQEYFYGQWSHIAAVLGCASHGEASAASILLAKTPKGAGLLAELTEDVELWELNPKFERDGATPFIDKLINGAAKG